MSSDCGESVTGDTKLRFARRMADTAKLAAALGLALRDLRSDFPHMMAEDLLDFAASVVMVQPIALTPRTHRL